MERLRHTGPFCRTREQLEKYKLTVSKQFMPHHPYFCKYVLLNFEDIVLKNVCAYVSYFLAL